MTFSQTYYNIHAILTHQHDLSHYFYYLIHLFDKVAFPKYKLYK